MQLRLIFTFEELVFVVVEREAIPLPSFLLQTRPHIQPNTSKGKSRRTFFLIFNLPHLDQYLKP